MAIHTSGNPLVFDGAGTKTGFLLIREIQWVDDAADVADGDDMVLTMNGVTLTFKVQVNGADFGSCLVWRAGPFHPPVKVENFTVTTLSHGAIHVWLL